mgnify:CR=1 FL=1
MAVPFKTMAGTLSAYFTGLIIAAFWLAGVQRINAAAGPEIGASAQALWAASTYGFGALVGAGAVSVVDTCSVTLGAFARTGPNFARYVQAARVRSLDNT